LRRDPFHFGNEFLIPLITSHPDAKEAPPASDFDDDKLKLPGRLNKLFTSNVHPLDVVYADLSFPISASECNSFGCDDQLSIADSVEKKYNRRDDDKKDDNVGQRIPVDHGELILDEISTDPYVEDECHQVDERLLIVEIQFVFEDMFHVSTRDGEKLFRNRSRRVTVGERM
jgi:hypothetical protein